TIGISVAAAAAGARVAIRASGKVPEIADRVAAHADASADEWRDLVPCAEVDVTVEQERPFRLAARVTIVSRAAAGNGADIEAVEIRLAAIFSRHVEAQPIIDVIADAETEEGG